MSLRDINAPFPDDPRALHNEPLGNSTGLKSFHTTQPEDIAPSNTPKIVGAIAVALMIGVAGVTLYTSAGHSPQPKAVATASNLPAPPAAQPAPAPTPAGMTPDANTPAAPPAAADNAPAPAAPVKEARAPVPKKHRIANADSTPANESANSAAATRMAADSTQSTVQPGQQQAVTAPAPSPSDVATNNTQPGVPPNAAAAADMPATAQNNPPAPPQAQSPAAPTADQPAGGAPAQSAGQVNQ